MQFIFRSSAGVLFGTVTGRRYAYREFNPSVLHRCFGGAFMYARERSEPRFNLAVPVRLRRLDEIGSTEYGVASSNLSVGGMYFSSNVQLEVNTPVRASLVLPEQIFGKPILRWQCDGRVARVSLSGPPGNRLGVGIWFHTYAVLNGGRLASIDECRSLLLRY